MSKQKFLRQIFEISSISYNKSLKLDDYHQLSQDFNCRILIISNDHEDIIINNFNYPCPAFVTIGIISNQDHNAINLILRKTNNEHICAKPIKFKIEDKLLEINKQLIQVATKAENLEKLKKLCMVKNIESTRSLHHEIEKSLINTLTKPKPIINIKPQPKLESNEDSKLEQVKNLNRFQELNISPDKEQDLDSVLDKNLFFDKNEDPNDSYFIVSKANQMKIPDNKRHAVKPNYEILSVMKDDDDESNLTSDTHKNISIKDDIERKGGFSLEPDTNNWFMFRGNDEHEKKDILVNDPYSQVYMQGLAGIADKISNPSLNYENNQDLSIDQILRRSRIVNFGQKSVSAESNPDLPQTEKVEDIFCIDCLKISETEVVVEISCKCKICLGCLLNTYRNKACSRCNIILNDEDLKKINEIFGQA